MPESYTFRINGEVLRVAADAGRPLLDVLREDLGLTGTKYGCGEGACGACTVVIDGEAIRSCITSVSELEGATVETIEGLSGGDELHPLQQAFIEKSASQCGYCVPGQIMNALALLRREPHADRERIVEAMDGNLCRCCNYRRIRDAVEHVATR